MCAFHKRSELYCRLFNDCLTVSMGMDIHAVGSSWVEIFGVGPVRIRVSIVGDGCRSGS